MESLFGSLRPCPFCAHDRCEVIEFDTQPGPAYAVHCPECGAHGPVDPMPEAAVYKWQRRDDVPDVELDGDTAH
jgi:hypothetical protein